MKLLVYIENPLSIVYDSLSQQQIAELWFTYFHLNVQIANFQTHRIERFTEARTTVLTFGPLPKRLEGKVKYIELPTFIELKKIEENLATRTSAINTLTQLKKDIEDLTQKEVVETKKIDAEDLPDLEAKHLILLKESIDKLGKTSFLLKSKNGKLVEINSTGQLDNQQVDFALSFEELYMVRLAIDVLGTKEVSIVSINSENNHRNND